MNNARLSGTHWGLLTVLGVALIIDVMKPATLGFVMPGMREEYGYSTAQVAMLPTVALTGTTIGSLVWGILADRVGRRAAILLATLMFIGTSICGFMPEFTWNLVMCFLMGTSAGGMLPIVYALMTECMPSKNRGWLVVLHAGLGTVGGYLAASGMAALLEPHFAWRSLWFVGLPTGVLMLIMSRWIPESPRFLLTHGREREAEAVLARFGVTVPPAVVAPEGSIAPTPVPAPVAASSRSRLQALVRPPLGGQTATVVTYGLGWGLVNWGFLTFIPVTLRSRGLDAEIATRLLFYSALLAIPGTIVVAWLYGMWSSKKSMVFFALATALALVGFAVIDPGSNGEPSAWLTPLMVLLLVSSGGVISMLSPYAAEVFPTHLRGTASGVAAGSSKLGGIIAPATMAALAAMQPGFTLIGLAFAIPLVVSAGMVALSGIETRGRHLEDTAGESLPAAS
ncbi:MAG: MFS transporter [Gemmatimonadetes bacterium]|nr:MFS transporter [Gemmatimonadota bacterium]